MGRPRRVAYTLVLLVFLGVTALAGGTVMSFGLSDSLAPPELLVHIPVVDSWLLPGLVLGIGFGLGSLAVAYGIALRPPWRAAGPFEEWTGHHWAWGATVLLGTGHVAWIALELVWLPDVSWLEGLFGAVGLMLMILPFTTEVERHLRLGRT